MRQALQQLGSSLLFGLITLLLIFGSMAAALAEKRTNFPPTVTVTETSLPTSVPQQDNFTDTPVAPSLLPSPSITPSPTSTATIPPSTACPAPAGWSSYIVQLGDTLDALATRYGISAVVLQQQNCLVTNELLPDTRLYVPPFPTATPIPCGPPYNWTVFYTVQSGDNLYRISLKYRVTVLQLQQANCLGYSTRITVGQQLYVPNVPTSTPDVTDTPTPTKTFTPTQTAPSPTNTATFTPSPTTEVTEISPTSETPVTEE